MWSKDGTWHYHTGKCVSLLHLFAKCGRFFTAAKLYEYFNICRPITPAPAGQLRRVEAVRNDHWPKANPGAPPVAPSLLTLCQPLAEKAARPLAQPPRHPVRKRLASRWRQEFEARDDEDGERIELARRWQQFSLPATSLIQQLLRRSRTRTAGTTLAPCGGTQGHTQNRQLWPCSVGPHI